MKADYSFTQSKSSSKAVCRERSSGFTLVELMIVIAVIAIMLAAAVPSVISWETNQGLQYAVDELYGDIQLARLRAARNNRRCRIEINMPAANQYTIRDVDNNGAVLGIFKTVDLSKFRGGIMFVNSPDAADLPPYATLDLMSQGVVDTASVLPAGSDSIYLTNRDFLVNPAGATYYRVLISAAGGTDVDRWVPNTNQWR